MAGQAAARLQTLEASAAAQRSWLTLASIGACLSPPPNTSLSRWIQASLWLASRLAALLVVRRRLAMRRLLGLGRDRGERAEGRRRERGG